MYLWLGAHRSDNAWSTHTDKIQYLDLSSKHLTQNMVVKLYSKAPNEHWSYRPPITQNFMSSSPCQTCGPQLINDGWASENTFIIFSALCSKAARSFSDVAPTMSSTICCANRYEHDDEKITCQSSKRALSVALSFHKYSSKLFCSTPLVDNSIKTTIFECESHLSFCGKR